jgi:phage recombination protein Bet
VGRRFVDMRTIQRRMQFKDDRINRALQKIAEKEEQMDRALATIAPTAPTVTEEQLELITRTIAKDATVDELKLYLHDCARQHVHPLDKLIHFTKRSNKYTPVTSIDFFRIRAAESGECAGIDEPIFVGKPKTADFAATVTVWRLVQGARYAFTATARWSEYVPDQAFMWNKMPHTMLGKCAEALALRKGFPKQLAGLYVNEEMAQAGNSSSAPARSHARESQQDSPVAPDRAAPANVNNPAVPDSWQPFIAREEASHDPDRLQGRIVAITDETKTNRKGTPFTKWSITLDSGELVTTLDRDHASTAIMAKDDEALVELTTKTTRWGKDIVTIARLPEADSDEAF